MNKKIIILFLIFAFLTVGIWYWSLQDKKNKDLEDSQDQNEFSQDASQSNFDIILFYGKQCPHCKDVEDFIEENNITAKVNFANLEVWYNEDNRNLLLEKAKGCGYTEENLGVPFLYARGECFSGTPDIEEFFKKEAGI